MEDVRLPKLPAFVPSQLGPVPVVLVKHPGKKKQQLLGRYGMASRQIEITSKATHAAQWQILFHEWAHMVIFDAGLHNAFTAEQQEIICDAFGTARAVELREANRGQQEGRRRR